MQKLLLDSENRATSQIWKVLPSMGFPSIGGGGGNGGVPSMRMHVLYCRTRNKNTVFFAVSLLTFLDHIYLCVLEKMATLPACHHYNYNLENNIKIFSKLKTS